MFMSAVDTQGQVWLMRWRGLTNVFYYIMVYSIIVRNCVVLSTFFFINDGWSRDVVKSWVHHFCTYAQITDQIHKFASYLSPLFQSV